MSDNQETKIEEKIETAQANTSISPENEINWKKFREEKEAQRKALEQEKAEKIEAQKKAEALKAAMEALVQKPNSNHSDNYEDRGEESEDSRIQKKIAEALAAERKRQDDLSREREMQELPQRLQQIHSDFSDVCTQENLDYLEYHHPEIARAFNNSPEGLQKWSDLYKTVKRLVPNPDSRRDQNKADRNTNKPQSMAVGGITQTGDHAPMGMLNEQKKSSNWARMQKIMKGVK